MLQNSRGHGQLREWLFFRDELGNKALVLFDSFLVLGELSGSVTKANDMMRRMQISLHISIIIVKLAENKQQKCG